MEQPSNSSNVTVEFTDPSGTYVSFCSELRHQLPLRHLHWKSQSRPVRTIDTLNVELIPDQEPLGVKDSEPAFKGESPRKERRHQIPGLRKTPYLKIYLLQCSDADSYRVDSRKLLRDWVKDHTPPSQSSTSLNKQDNHDAFEWLIIHLLPAPTDGATSRPPIVFRTEPGKKQSSSKWSSRSSSSVIEKIRADFNGTSKNLVDRVAQVQMWESPEDDLGRAQLQSQDDKNGWDDLIAKMKSLLLASFDLRVNQYEEDIRERELQRNLPGWNFNTFFILKEGLLRGFESVGLVEDALAGYHELAAGLSAIMDGQSGEGTAKQQAPLFSDSTEDLIELFKQAEHCSKSNGTLWQQKRHIVDLGARILDTDRKPFRDLILANKISSFDFQNYVFARQVSLLLRLVDASDQDDLPTAGASPESGSDTRTGVGIQPLKVSSEARENLIILADVAQRASTFISSAAATIRDDIRSGLYPSSDGQNGNDGFSNIEHKEIVENLAASWVFSASKCILEATSTRSLSAQLDPLLCQLKTSLKSTDADNENWVGPLVNAVHREGLPDRTSSLKAHPSVNSPPPILGSTSFVPLLDAVRLLPPTSSHSGTGELASQRGDLLALARRALSGLGLQHLNRRGGLADVCQTFRAEEEEMQEVKLGDPKGQEKKLLESLPVNTRDPAIAGVCNANLLSALRSKYDFYQTFEELTISMLANYVIGGRTKGTEGMAMDLAVTRFLLEDYDVAASYFRQLAPFYARNDWSDLELLTLDLYAQCLHRVERNTNYVRIGLKTLAKSIRGKTGMKQRPQDRTMKLGSIDQASLNAASSLASILITSKSLKERISLPMDDYFDHIDMGKYLRHSNDDDSFQFPLVLRSLLPERFLAESVRVQILSAEEEQRSELWLHASCQSIQPGMCRIWLESNTMFPTWYVLNQVTILVGNILFVHNLSPPSDGSHFAKSKYTALSEVTRRQRMLLWPHSKSLEVRVSHSETTDLDRLKSIIVNISTGQNNIIQGRLSLRAASAGLRLHTAEAEIRDGNVTVVDKSKPGSISFGQLLSNTTANINVPYSLESDLKEITARVEVIYTTERGEFVYACVPKISTVLPITINVRDTFRKSALFSTFTVGTANAASVKILNCTIEGNENYDVISQSIDDGEHDVFVRQPLSLVSRIYPTSRGKQDLDANEAIPRTLRLHVEYRCLDQDILTIAEKVLSTNLAATPFTKFSRLLIPALLSTLSSRYSTQQLEAVSILGKVDVGTYEEYGWDSSIIAGLPYDLGEELGIWLRNWHNVVFSRPPSLTLLKLCQDHPTIAFKDIDQPSPTQRLTVPFGVPHVHVLHTVRMRALRDPAKPSLQHDSLTIGSVLPLQFIVNNTRKWWDGDARSSSIGKLLDFEYEVQALPDDWSIGGQKKGHFSTKAGETSSFAILLLPQRTGHLMFPSIDIRPLPSPRNLHQANDRDDSVESSISCETDYLPYSQTIQVVSDLSSTTVGVDLGSMVGAAWLAESKRRWFHDQSF